MSSLNDVKESLEHAIHVLSGILEDVKSGTYTPEQAYKDADCLMMTEGLDFISAISDYAENGEEDA
jgi:hypothetical protein